MPKVEFCSAEQTAKRIPRFLNLTKIWLTHEKGAISVLFVILTSFLLVGLLVLVIDVGSIYSERRQLQKVADSAVSAIAQGCYKNDLKLCISQAKSSSWPTQLQQLYANDNSNDGRTKIDLICGSMNSSLSSCIGDPSGSYGYDCKPIDSAKYPNHVRIRVSTLSRSGETFLSPLLSQFFGSTGEALRIKACSQAIWQVPYAAEVVYPLIMSPCYFSDNSLRSYNAWDPNVPLSDPSAGPTSNGYCPYTPIGAPTILYPEKVITGSSLIKNLNGSSIGCPTPLNPVILKVGDIVEVVPFGEKSSLSSRCESIFPSLGVSGGNNDEKYDDFLDKYIFDTVLYLPVASKVLSDKKLVEVGGFVSFRVKGIFIEKKIQTGCSISNFNSSADSCITLDWADTGISRDCETRSDGTNYCVFGRFVRTTPPKPSAPTPSPAPTSVNYGLVSVSIIP